MTGYQFLSAGLVLLADQVSKSLVTDRLSVGQSISLGSCLRIHYVVRRFSDQGLMGRGPALLLLWGALLAIVAVLMLSGYFFQRPAAQVGLAVALAGAAGNLFDRLRLGAVIDFVDLGWWPVFNLADVAITLGVMTAIWFI